MKTYVAYNTNSGQIISVHHGAIDVNQARKSAHQRSKIAQEHIDVIAVQSEAGQRGKLYKVDTSRKVLVEAAAGEGFGFAFGATATLRKA